MQTISSQECVVLIQPRGRLDHEGGAGLRNKLSEIEPEQHRLWIVDLAQVDFIDSAGLVALINGLNLASTHQCRMVLQNPHPAVKLVLEITRLDQVFDLLETCLDAVAGDKPVFSTAQQVA
jgi:anti-sigma B factor antagonist